VYEGVAARISYISPHREAKVRKSIVALCAAAVMALAATSASAASIVKVADPTPNGAFTDAQGNQGYVEVLDDGVRACNENEATPAGDQVTGYAWVSAGGESTPPTYGNENIGAGDADGEGVDDGDDTNGTEGDDCP
jgi:hypothetical protein